MSSRIQTVAVIGAGVSGVSSALHLGVAGLEVTVYEQSSSPGGVWYVGPKALRLFLKAKTKGPYAIASGCMTSGLRRSQSIHVPIHLWQKTYSNGTRSSLNLKILSLIWIRKLLLNSKISMLLLGQ